MAALKQKEGVHAFAHLWHYGSIAGLLTCVLFLLYCLGYVLVRYAFQSCVKNERSFGEYAKYHTLVAVGILMYAIFVVILVAESGSRAFVLTPPWQSLVFALTGTGPASVRVWCYCLLKDAGQLLYSCSWGRLYYRMIFDMETKKQLPDETYMYVNEKSASRPEGNGLDETDILCCIKRVAGEGYAGSKSKKGKKNTTLEEAIRMNT